MRLLRIIALVVVVALLLAGGVVGGAFVAFTSYFDRVQGEAGEPIELTVPEGSSAREVAEELEAQGVVGPSWLFLLSLRTRGLHTELKAGEYLFEPPLSPRDAAMTIVEGRVRTHPVTIPEGLDLDETARLLSDAGFGEYEALLEAFSDPELIAELDPLAENLEGYLFPETYRFSRGDDERRIAETLIETGRRRFFEPRAEELAAAELSARELVTLASLVEKETGIAEERGLIAGVFATRLDRGMRLQCDPTVIYTLKLLGRWDGNIRKRDLSLVHPYNTYTTRGLPPGPIASPGLEALEAALAPERDGSLYFVARGDGGHVFSKTLVEHQRAVREYLRNRRKRR